MKKSICFITYKHIDKDIIESLKFSKEYYGKYIVFPLENILEKNIWGIPLRSIQNIYQCIEESDIIFISNVARDKYVNLDDYIEYANKLNKNIVFSSPSTSQQSCHFEDINIPIILLNSMGQDLHHIPILLSLKNLISSDIGNVAVLTTDDILKIFYDFYYIEDFYDKKDLAFITQSINKRIHQLINNKKLKCLIIHISSGIFNPYDRNNIKNIYLLQHLSDACQIDYTASIMPINLKDSNKTIEYSNILKNKFDLHINYYVFDNIFWDMPKKNSKYESIILDSYKLTSSKGKEVNPGEYSMIAFDIFQDIVDKLSKKPNYDTI